MESQQNSAELSERRNAQVEALRALGLEVNFIQPEIFEDGVIEIQSAEKTISQQLTYSDLFHEFSDNNRDHQALASAKLSKLVKANNLDDFDAVIIRAHDNSGVPPNDTKNEKNSTQIPHFDTFGLNKNGEKMGAIAIHYRGNAPRTFKTFVTAAKEVAKINSIGGIKNKIRTLISQLIGAENLAGYREGDNQILNQIILRAPHLMMEYQPGDTLIIMQNGPLQLMHGRFVDRPEQFTTKAEASFCFAGARL